MIVNSFEPYSKLHVCVGIFTQIWTAQPTPICLQPCILKSSLNY